MIAEAIQEGALRRQETGYRCFVTTAGWQRTVGTLGGTEPSRLRTSLEALLGGRVVVFLAVSWFIDEGVFPETADGGGATLRA